MFPLFQDFDGLRQLKTLLFSEPSNVYNAMTILEKNSKPPPKGKFGRTAPDGHEDQQGQTSGRAKVLLYQENTQKQHKIFSRRPKAFSVIVWVHLTQYGSKTYFQRQKNLVIVSVLPTRKFLHVRKLFARNPLCSRKFSDHLESFPIVWKVSG